METKHYCIVCGKLLEKDTWFCKTCKRSFRRVSCGDRVRIQPKSGQVYDKNVGRKVGNDYSSIKNKPKN